jgi:glycogen synthase
MRVLVSTDSVGGVWRYALTLAGAWARMGVSTSLAVLGPDPDEAQRREASAIPGLRLRPTGLPLDWTAPDPGALVEAASALRALASADAVDTVHLHAPALLGEPSWPVPVAVVAHSCLLTWWQAMRDGPPPADFLWRIEAARLGLCGANAAIAPSQAFARAVTAAYRLARPVQAIRNGRTPLPDPARPAAERPRAVLSAGRFWDEAKGAATLDAAAAVLDAPVWAAGSWRGPHGAGLEPRHLRPLGSLDELALADAFGAARVFASAAHYEPFGLSVLEAAQSGLALVLSDIPTFRELWDGAARFVPAGDAGALARALAEALDDPAPLADAARARARRYGATPMAEATLHLHRRLVAGAVPAQRIA